MKGDSFKVQNLIPAAVIPFIAPLTSMAAEGVGRVRDFSFSIITLIASFPIAFRY